MRTKILKRQKNTKYSKSKKNAKKPFVWEPKCCPCARARGEALSPGGGAYFPTDDDHDYDEDLIII